MNYQHIIAHHKQHAKLYATARKNIHDKFGLNRYLILMKNTFTDIILNNSTMKCINDNKTTTINYVLRDYHSDEILLEKMNQQFLQLSLQFLYIYHLLDK